VLFFAINTLKSMRVQFVFLSLESRGVIFEIYLTTSCYLSIVLNFMRSIIFDSFRSVSVVYKSHVFPFSAILTLGNVWVHICSSNSYNVMSDIKASVVLWQPLDTKSNNHTNK